jgi:hypothetical protein
LSSLCYSLEDVLGSNISGPDTCFNAVAPWLLEARLIRGNRLAETYPPILME